MPTVQFAPKSLRLSFIETARERGQRGIEVRSREALPFPQYCAKRDLSVGRTKNVKRRRTWSTRRSSPRRFLARRTCEATGRGKSQLRWRSSMINAKRRNDSRDLLLEPVVHLGILEDEDEELRWKLRRGGGLQRSAVSETEMRKTARMIGLHAFLMDWRLLPSSPI